MFYLDEKQIEKIIERENEKEEIEFYVLMHERSNREEVTTCKILEMIL
jgi:hypothetical protein